MLGGVGLLYRAHVVISYRSLLMREHLNKSRPLPTIMICQAVAVKTLLRGDLINFDYRFAKCQIRFLVNCYNQDFQQI